MSTQVLEGVDAPAAIGLAAPLIDLASDARTTLNIDLNPAPPEVKVPMIQTAAEFRKKAEALAAATSG